MNLSNNLKQMVDNRDYKQIKITIKKFIENGEEYLESLLDNLKLTIIKLHENNDEYIIIKNKLMEIFSFMVYLYKNIDFELLIENIKCNNTEFSSSLDNQYKIFLNIIKYVNNEYINLYQDYYKNKLNNLDGIYIACLMKLYYHQTHYEEQLGLLKYIMPEIFEQYPLYEYYKILFIESIINEQNISDDD